MNSNLVNSIKAKLVNYGAREVVASNESGICRIQYVSQPLSYDQLKAIEEIAYPEKNDGLNKIIPFKMFGVYTFYIASAV